MKRAILLISITITISAVAYYFYTKKIVKSQTFYAMGTNLTISIAEENFNPEIFELGFKEFKRVEALFKAKADLNNQEINRVYQIALKLQKETNGSFSPYLQDVFKLWQFNKTNRTISTPPSKNEIAKALKSKNINLYAIAKGYGIDKVAQLLKQNNINNFIVNAGGDLFVSGKKFGETWSIGLKHSDKILNCNLNSYAIATSSNLYNYYIFEGKKYGHLINGNTGWPTQANKAISILTNNTTMADGLATAVFIDESLIKKDSKTLKFATLKQSDEKFSIFNLPENCKLKKIGL